MGVSIQCEGAGVSGVRSKGVAQPSMQCHSYIIITSFWVRFGSGYVERNSQFSDSVIRAL